MSSTKAEMKYTFACFKITLQNFNFVLGPNHAEILAIYCQVNCNAELTTYANVILCIFSELTFEILLQTGLVIAHAVILF